MMVSVKSLTFYPTVKSLNFRAAVKILNSANYRFSNATKENAFENPAEPDGFLAPAQTTCTDIEFPEKIQYHILLW